MIDLENLPPIGEIQENAQPVALVCGVYFLFNRGKLIYVGQSLNIMRRVGDHLSSKQFDSYSYVEIEPARLALAERMFIDSLNPSLNQSLNTRVTTSPVHARECHQIPQTSPAQLRLKNLLVRLGVTQREFGLMIIQTHGPAKDRPLSLSAISLLVNQNTWPSWTPAASIKSQAEKYLLSVGVTENELEAIWEPENGSEASTLVCDEIVPRKRFLNLLVGNV